MAVAQVPLADGVGHVAARLEVLGQQLVLRAQTCTQKYLRTIRKYLLLTGWLVSADVAALEAEAPGVLAGEERGPAGGAGGVGVVAAQDNPGPGHRVMCLVMIMSCVMQISPGMPADVSGQGIRIVPWDIIET